MGDQHLYKSPAIDVYSHCTDYYYPDCGCLVDFFCNLGLKNCWHGGLGIDPTTLDLSSQSGAYDLSAMATPALIQLLKGTKYLIESDKTVSKIQ